MSMPEMAGVVAAQQPESVEGVASSFSGELIRMLDTQHPRETREADEAPPPPAEAKSEVSTLPFNSFNPLATLIVPSPAPLPVMPLAQSENEPPWASPVISGKSPAAGIAVVAPEVSPAFAFPGPELSPVIPAAPPAAMPAAAPEVSPAFAFPGPELSPVIPAASPAAKPAAAPEVSSAFAFAEPELSLAIRTVPPASAPAVKGSKSEVSKNQDLPIPSLELPDVPEVRSSKAPAEQSKAVAEQKDQVPVQQAEAAVNSAKAPAEIKQAFPDRAEREAATLELKAALADIFAPPSRPEQAAALHEAPMQPVAPRLDAAIAEKPPAGESAPDRRPAQLSPVAPGIEFSATNNFTSADSDKDAPASDRNIFIARREGGARPSDAEAPAFGIRDLVQPADPAALTPAVIARAANAQISAVSHPGAEASAPAAPAPQPHAAMAAAADEAGLPRALSTWHSTHSNATRLVESARLIERLAESEMHINLRTAELGPVELRAVMRENSLVASINVERSDVRALLVGEMPALERALGDQNLRVDKLDIFDGSLGSAMSFDGRSNPDTREFSQPHQPAFFGRMTAQESAHAEVAPAESPAVPVHPRRLSIRA
ncbi:MAG: flagellar hook-length control protein FliK [Acidobacteria bacterium]|nr:flagellar hook-length control protein FliK [Acidobacteriota bacterium]MBI3663008.1 flagellar hook-length control protein FliK [Acidobacteriota bacterium]